MRLLAHRDMVAGVCASFSTFAVRNCVKWNSTQCCVEILESVFFFIFNTSCSCVSRGVLGGAQDHSWFNSGLENKKMSGACVVSKFEIFCTVTTLTKRPWF